MLKYFILASIVSMPLFSMEKFTDDFVLKDVKVDGRFAHITLEHSQTFSPTRFELIPFQSCRESFPPQCSATVVRLDHQFQADQRTQTTIEVDMVETFGYEGPVNVVIRGADREIKVSY
ncbi:MAG: hypothetical protein KC478_13970 [Bacteriovoracaceae bacterium]|nr:hypothetical protein [Bacteriovoracaceae bacterium]